MEKDQGGCLSCFPYIEFAIICTDFSLFWHLGAYFCSLFLVNNFRAATLYIQNRYSCLSSTISPQKYTIDAKFKLKTCSISLCIQPGAWAQIDMASLICAFSYNKTTIIFSLSKRNKNPQSKKVPQWKTLTRGRCILMQLLFWQRWPEAGGAHCGLVAAGSSALKVVQGERGPRLLTADDAIGWSYLFISLYLCGAAVPLKTRFHVKHQSPSTTSAKTSAKTSAFTW